MESRFPTMGFDWLFMGNDYRAIAEREMVTVNGVLTYGRNLFSFQHLTNVAMNGDSSRGERE
jgi:hypothetical protein